MSNIEEEVSSSREYVGISLWIKSGTLSASTISDALGLEAVYSHVLGEPVLRTGRFYEQHAWKWGSRLYGNDRDYIGRYVPAFFDEFFCTLKSCSAEIKNISLSHSVSVEAIYNVTNMPFVGLSREQIQACADLGARVSFDVMIKCGH